MQDSLGGNTKTLMVAAISPADYNFDETMSTLRYANRAKNIKNKPKINEDPKDAMLREYKDEISKLKLMLAEAAANPNASAAPPAAAASAFDDSAIVAGVLDSLNSQASANVHTKYITTEKIVEVEKVVEVKNGKVYADAMGLVGDYNKSLVDQRNKMGDELERKEGERQLLEKRLQKLSLGLLGTSGDFDGKAKERHDKVSPHAPTRARTHARAHTTHTQHIHNTYTTHTQHIHNRYTTHTQLTLPSLFTHTCLLSQLRQKQKRKKEKAAEKIQQTLISEKAEQQQELDGVLEEVERLDIKHKREKKKIMKKLKEATLEIEDLKDEFDHEREGLFDMVREQDKEIKLWEAVARQFIDESQVSFYAAPHTPCERKRRSSRAERSVQNAHLFATVPVLVVATPTRSSCAERNAPLVRPLFLSRFLRLTRYHATLSR